MLILVNQKRTKGRWHPENDQAVACQFIVLADNQLTIIKKRFLLICKPLRFFI